MDKHHSREGIGHTSLQRQVFADHAGFSRLTGDAAQLLLVIIISFRSEIGIPGPAIRDISVFRRSILGIHKIDYLRILKYNISSTMTLQGGFNMQWDKLLSDGHYSDANSREQSLFRSDYDTIICSTLFRRLQDKAQVFPLDEDDYVRTRLTHSLEVSAIGKKLGEYVFSKLKKENRDAWFATHTEKNFSDVLLCAGLVHDIGNPPFGHFGEYSIREWFQKNLHDLYMGGRRVTDILSQWQIQDLLHFEGNAQSIRLLSKTPYLGAYNGFDLSYKVLGSIIKYPVSSQELSGSRYKKIGYHYCERELFEKLSAAMGLNGARHPLSFLLEAADDIAYRTSDLEDAMVKKVISYQQITGMFKNRGFSGKHNKDYDMDSNTCMSKLSQFYREAIDNKVRNPELTAVQRWTQYIQEIMIEEAGESFARHYEELMNGDFNGDLFDDTFSGYMIQAISELSEKYIYTSSVKTKTELFGRRVIHSLLDQFLPAVLIYDTEESMTFIQRRTVDTVSNFYKTMYHEQAKGKSESDRLYLRILMITDFISGMTDNYAKRLYRELNV